MLRRDEIGKSLHADKIEEAYHEEIDRHEPCEKCNTGTVLHGPYSKVFPKYCVRYSVQKAYVFVEKMNPVFQLSTIYVTHVQI